jgi:hypothetical protein
MSKDQRRAQNKTGIIPGEVGKSRLGSNVSRGTSKSGKMTLMNFDIDEINPSGSDEDEDDDSKEEDDDDSYIDVKPRK